MRYMTKTQNPESGCKFCRAGALHTLSICAKVQTAALLEAQANAEFDAMPERNEEPQARDDGGKRAPIAPIQPRPQLPPQSPALAAFNARELRGLQTDGVL